MFIDNINYLPTKEKKYKKFSINVNDHDHKEVLMVAHATGSCRAATAREMMKLGIQEWCKRHGLDPSEQGTNEYLALHQMLDISERS